MADGNFQAAVDTFTSTGLLEMGYKDSEELSYECYYQMAVDHFESDNYAAAVDAFSQISDYKDSANLRQESLYILADQEYAAGNRNEAIRRYRELGTYKDATELANSITYEAGKACYDEEKYPEAIEYFKQIPEYEDAAEQVLSITYKIAKDLFNAGKYVEAIRYFQQVSEYKDAGTMINECKYKYCSANKHNPDDTTKTYIKELTKIKYKESASLSKTIFKWKAKVDIKVSLRMGTMTGVSFNADLSGGDGTSTKVKFVVKMGGQTFKYCDDKKYKAGDEPSCQLSHSSMDITKKTYSVKVYDGKGNLIGSASGKPTEY